MPEVKPPKEGTLFTRITQSPDDRKPVAVSLGPVITGAACPHPDQYDTSTTLAGIIKRAASKHPDVDTKVLADFKVFVKNWLSRNLTPLAPDSDVSVERWLEHCNYPAWRKQELREKYAKVLNRRDPRHHVAKCFIKDETYPEYKHARGIYSRSDEFKCFVGPFFKLIEEEVYKHPSFIKHVPVADRPAYITDLLDGDGLAESTDYVAYESQFRDILMDAAEFQLYIYMTQFLPGFEEFEFNLGVISSRQRVIFKYVDAEIDTCRLSGEMCTSLGNGFTNLMVALFVADRKGCTNVRIVVEGDDGLMKHSGPSLSAEDFAPLGLTIKIEKHDRIETASFCGIIFDSEELINIDDPRGVLATFGWGRSNYVLSNNSKKLRLLRCKSLSLAHQYPGCPIISELAQYGLRVTRHVRIGNIGLVSSRNMWERDQNLLMMRALDEGKIVYREPGPRSRALVESMFGISITVQRGIEEYLRCKNDVGPLNSEWINLIMPEVWNDYSATYVRYVSRSTLNIQSFVRSKENWTHKMLRLEGVNVSHKVAVKVGANRAPTRKTTGRQRP